ncbi:MAG: hypothetical protein RLZZ535_2832 [Cyanobacteriota bacterium]
MVDLPELGIGVVYTPSLEPLIEAGQEQIQVLEIEPQPFWFKTRSPENPYCLNKKIFERIQQYSQPKIIHSVGLPIGSSLPLEEDFINCLIESVKKIKPAWVSEHLSFNRIRNKEREFNTGFLLPPIQTFEAVKIAADNINYLRDRLDIPFAFETGVNYLQPLPGEMTDGNFFAAVAETADCGILLDLHNLWCNEKNGRSSVRQVIAELPRDRVWELHLAGGQSWQGYWLDAHSGIVPIPVMQLAAEIIPTLPNLKAIFFELSENYLQTKHFPVDLLLEQIQQMQQLWNLRCNQKARISRLSSSPVFEPHAHVLPSVSEWEEALGCFTAKQPTNIELTNIKGDRGIEILQYLVSTMRGGTAVNALKLSSRLLMLSLGKDNFRQLLEKFWQTTPPEMFATEEAKNLANYLKLSNLNIPYLDELLNFELAGYQVLIQGLPQKVKFSCEPMSLLNALDKNRLPENIIKQKFEIVLNP